MVDISSIINISDIITGLGILRREFGIPLFVTTDDSYLGTGANRVMRAANADDISDVFDEDTEPYDAAAIYFQQVPFPKNLVVGRWIDSDVAANILGSTPSALSVLIAINDGSFECKGEDFTAVDLTTATTLAEVAALIQTELRTGSDADFTDATCTYNVTKARFEVTTGTAVGDTATLTVFTAVDPAVGTDISELLGLGETATLNQGASTETIVEAIEAILALEDAPYFITLENTITDFDVVDSVREWVASRRYMYAYGSLEAGALTTGESATVAAQLSALEPPRTFGFWSATGDYKELSFVGRFSSVNFSGANELITGNLKELPGTTPDTLTTTQVAELKRKNLNYYTQVFSTGSNPVSAAFNGTTFKQSVWIDVRYWFDWLVNAMQVDLFNLLYNSKRVPQTEAGITALQRVVDDVMQQGVRNGGIAPGTLSAASILDVQQTTGNLDFDGYLPKGYLIYFLPISEQAQSDRNERKAPPGYVWMKGSGAIHFVDMSLTFEN